MVFLININVRCVFVRPVSNCSPGIITPHLYSAESLATILIVFVISFFSSVGFGMWLRGLTLPKYSH